MPFIIKKFPAVTGKKIQQFLIDEVGLSVSMSQKLIAKCRVFDADNKVLQNGEKLKTDFVQVALFEGITRGLNPMFTTKSFALFDKPSGVMVHPTSRNTEYTLLDEIRYHFGESANLAHRIDQETSGLVLITRDKLSDMILKEKFENKQYKKSYLAVVKGKLTRDQNIDIGIKKDIQSTIGVKMCTSKEGKESFTYVRPLKYDVVQDHTLIEASPHTGRQHQIRVHLHHIGYPIVGDPIYGVDEKVADKYLLKKLSEKERVEYTGAKRLFLHANYLEFSYEKQVYKIYSKLSLK
jgi:23S rRNA pseudouridine1911/1915/1917 synthase